MKHVDTISSPLSLYPAWMTFFSESTTSEIYRIVRRLVLFEDNPESREPLIASQWTPSDELRRRSRENAVEDIDVASSTLGEILPPDDLRVTVIVPCCPDEIAVVEVDADDGCLKPWFRSFSESPILGNEMPCRLWREDWETWKAKRDELAPDFRDIFGVDFRPPSFSHLTPDRQ